VGVAERRARRRGFLEMLWDYVEDLERAAEEFFETMLGERMRPCWDVRGRCLEPLTQVSVAPDEVVITMDLPLVRPETIRVRPVEEDTIEVVAEMKRALRTRELGVPHVDGEIRTLRARARVPVPVEIRAIRFEFRRGILEVRLPRKRRIEIE